MLCSCVFKFVLFCLFFSSETSLFLLLFLKFNIAGTREDQLRATVASIEALKREELNLIRAHSRSVNTTEYLPLAPLLDRASNPLLAGEITFPKDYTTTDTLIRPFPSCTSPKGFIFYGAKIKL